MKDKPGEKDAIEIRTKKIYEEAPNEMYALLTDFNESAIDMFERIFKKNYFEKGKTNNAKEKI